MSEEENEELKEEQTESEYEEENEDSSFDLPEYSENKSLQSEIFKVILSKYKIPIIIGISFILIIILLVLSVCLLDSPNNKNNKSNSTECSKLDFYKTPLSKEQFVARVNDFLGFSPSETSRRFIDNASNIYDWGMEIGANPEMVYIIAYKEQGFNDKSRFALDCNNFYGVGVYNGQNTGKCFNNFEEGAKTILRYVKEKGSLDAFVKVYSYLGTYLASPGSRGDGGCIYLKLPEIYGPNYSRCNSSYKCGSSRGGVGCVLTTEAEKQAYIDYQASIILKHRKTIFNISEDECSVDEGMDGSTEGTTFLNEPIGTFLLKQNTTLEEFNDKIIEQGCKNRGTGQGVANVAATAVAGLSKYSKKFHYLWGGLHSKPDTYGVPANWGAKIGPDCSGLVNWALYNAGFNFNGAGATGLGALGTVTNFGDKRVKVGDYIVTPGDRGWNHIVIITAIHDGYYSTVEAASTQTGVVFGKSKISSPGNRKIILMSDYYEKAPKSEEFKKMCESR